MLIFELQTYRCDLVNSKSKRMQTVWVLFNDSLNSLDKSLKPSLMYILTNESFTDDYERKNVISFYPIFYILFSVGKITSMQQYRNFELHK